MSWKDLLVAGTAYKALKQSRPPGVIAPPGYTITGMEHKVELSHFFPAPLLSNLTFSSGKTRQPLEM